MSQPRDWTVFDRPELRPALGAEGRDGCEVLLALDGIHCANCVARAERVLGGKAADVHVNLTARTVGFRFRPQQVRLSELLRELDRAGLEPRVLAHEEPAARAARERRLAFARIGVASICAMQVMMLAWPSYFGVRPDHAIEQLLRWAQLAVAAPGVLWAGWPLFAAGWRAVRSGALDMNVPVALALAAAFGASALRTLAGSGDLYFDTATMFVWFLGVGRYLEGRTRARAGERLRLLAGRRALTAQRRSGGALETIPIGSLQPGDTVVVAPGDALPADGELLEVAAELDESLLTGESHPVTRQPGQAVLAGSVNGGDAPLALRVTHRGADTTLAQITRLLDLAQTRKPKVQQLADRAAGHFVAAILVFAAAGLLLALLRGAGADAGLSIALAVLVASCPCALSLAVPAALAAATSRLARGGVLVTNAGALPALAAVDTVLFDKTGTLTVPRLQVGRTLCLAGLAPQECLRIAAALEHGSRHPIAAAFTVPLTAPSAGDGGGLQAHDLRHLPGAGISGRIGDTAYWIGAAAQAGVPLPPEAAGLADDGSTVIVLTDTVRALACFALQAQLRPEARELVGELQRRGMNIEIYSGDAAEAVAAVARQLGIERYAARQSAQAKLQRLQQLQQQGATVLAVGDGLNDAPLLAAADVSAAMPQGAALTQARADLLLLGDSLGALAPALDVAQAARRRIAENLAWALGYNLVVLPLAMSGHLAPWLAAAGMSMSSLLVVGNALRFGGRRRAGPAARIEPAARPAEVL
ncbi:MAG: cadmium-translocating P-type ATPase [Nevskia sp.]|nr:cadmium-translocating P-type ATPase [Nevskia sp.]